MKIISVQCRKKQLVIDSGKLLCYNYISGKNAEMFSER